MSDGKTNSPVKWEGVITNIQGNILLKLAQYKFLTLTQLLKLDVGTSQYKYLWKQMASLRDRKRPLVRSQRFSVALPLNGNPPQRIEDWYCLNNAGKNALRNDLQFHGNIKMPIGRGNLAYKDYRHRRHTIDFQIALQKWAEKANIEIPFFDTYFDKSGNARTDKNLRAKTRIDMDRGMYFIPDGAFKVVQNLQEKFLLMEMCQGSDTIRAVAQIHNHARAMTNRFTHKAYNLPQNKSYLIILIYQKEALKNAVAERVKMEGNTFSVIQKYFRCKTLEEVENGDFFEGWATLFGEEVSLF